MTSLFLCLPRCLVKSHCSASNIFYKILCNQYKHNCTIPVLTDEHGAANLAEVDKLLELAHSGMSPYFKTLVADFEDSTGQNREPVLINLDAIYIQVSGSKDIEWQKLMFAAFKAHHIAKWLVFTNMDGKVVCVLPLASSQTPSSGDAFLVIRFSDLFDSQQSENILRLILRGNTRFFVVLCTDAGFVVNLRNKPTQIRNSPTLNDICEQEGAFLIHTSENHEAYHFERTASNKIRKIPVNEENRTMNENVLKFSRQIRKVQEQSHAGFKQMCKIINGLNVQASYFLPISKHFIRSFGLPDAYKKMPRLSVIAVVSCSIYNVHHPGFRQRYLAPDQEIPAAQRFMGRLFLENFFLYDGLFDIQFDKARGNWNETTFGGGSK